MRLLSAIFLVTSLVGCGGAPAGPTLFPVSGELTVGGMPLKGVAVQLIPTNPGVGNLLASGTTNEEGAFTMTASNGKSGVPKGTYKVVLSYNPVSTMTPEEQSKAASAPGAGNKPPASALPFPKTWTQPETSTQTYEVTEKPAPLKLSI